MRAVLMLPSLPHDWTNAENLVAFKPPIALAAGAAYWADATGVIRKLGRDGKVTEVTRFPIRDQQQLTFAVSPDGRQLMASVLTVPPFKQNPSCPWEHHPGAKWTMQTLAANTGSAAREVAALRRLPLSAIGSRDAIASDFYFTSTRGLRDRVDGDRFPGNGWGPQVLAPAPSEIVVAPTGSGWNLTLDSSRAAGYLEQKGARWTSRRLGG